MRRKIWSVSADIHAGNYRCVSVEERHAVRVCACKAECGPYRFGGEGSTVCLTEMLDVVIIECLFHFFLIEYCDVRKSRGIQ
jgi:hypothetical protein